MIVSLSLILCDTGLRLRCLQIATHYLTRLTLSLVLVPCDCDRCTALDESYPASRCNCVLVWLRLMQLTILAETQMLYYNKVLMG